VGKGRFTKINTRFSSLCPNGVFFVSFSFLSVFYFSHSFLSQSLLSTTCRGWCTGASLSVAIEQDWKGVSLSMSSRLRRVLLKHRHSEGSKLELPPFRRLRLHRLRRVQLKHSLRLLRRAFNRPAIACFDADVLENG
jgi:hypothetical protein